MSPRDPMTSRRDLLRLMGPVCAGLAAAGCVPRSVRHGLRSSVEDTLRAFGATVVPGADPVAADGIRALWDPELPFVRYAGLLARALDRRAGGDFVAADEASRVAAIANGPEAPLRLARPKDKRVRDNDDSAALRLGKPKAHETLIDAGLDAAVVQRGLLGRRRRDRAITGHHKLNGDLSSERRCSIQLSLVAVANLVRVALDDRIDQ